MDRRFRIAGAMLAIAASTVLPTALARAADHPLTVTATVAGASVKDAGSNSPIALRPNDTTVVSVAVTNTGSAPVEVRSVRLSGRVLGLAFFSYTTRVDLTVAPGGKGSRTFALDLSDLDGQATGLLPARLDLLSSDRTVLYSEHGTVDVKGKVLSVYGVFGLAVAAITALLLLSLAIALVRRTLPDNRWARSARFAVPGVGFGLVVTFSLGVARVLVPSTPVSLGLMVAGLLAGGVLGYLTPAPADEADRNELDERDVVRVSPAPTATVPTAPAPVPPYTPPPVPEDDDPRATRAVQLPPPPPPGS